MIDIQYIDVNLLDDHPDNPRLVVREDVVNAIAEQIKDNGGFDPAHALMVRPLDGRYQIVWGHHRKQAAIQVGLAEAPCWVREMTDDEAYLQLGFGNAQGEWKPIEIGLHALGIPKGKGGRGLEGGISEYATKMGKNEQNIGLYRQGAEVLRVVSDKTPTILLGFLDKAAHLAAIHKAPEELWPMLAEWILTNTVKQAQALSDVLRRYDVPMRWQNKFLPLTALAQSYMDSESPKPKTVRDLVQLANVIRKDIVLNRRQFGERFPRTPKEFYSWLTAGTGSYSWEAEKLREYYSEIKEAIPSEVIGEKCGPYDLNSVLVKDIINLKDIPDESIDLIFTDPPYAEGDLSCYKELAHLAARALKPGAYCMVYAGKMFLPEILKLLCKPDTLDYVWELCVFHPYSQSKITKYKLFENWRPIILLQKEGSGKRGGGTDKWVQDVVRGTRNKSQHDWQQDLEAPIQYIETFSDLDDVVLDPFVGGGTTPIACQELNRHFLAFDKDPNAVQKTQERLSERAKRLNG